MKNCTPDQIERAAKARWEYENDVIDHGKKVGAVKNHTRYKWRDPRMPIACWESQIEAMRVAFVEALLTND